jgi:hypothetical protein
MRISVANTGLVRGHNPHPCAVGVIGGLPVSQPSLPSVGTVAADEIKIKHMKHNDDASNDK